MLLQKTAATGVASRKQRAYSLLALSHKHGLSPSPFFVGMTMNTLFSFLAGILCALSFGASAVMAAPGTAPAGQGVMNTLERHGQARVIVTMNNQRIDELRADSRAYRPAPGQELSIHAAGHPDRLLAQAVEEAAFDVAGRASIRGRVELLRPFRVVNGFVAVVDPEGLQALKNDPRVEAVVDDRPVPVPDTGGLGSISSEPISYPQVNNSTSIVEADSAWDRDTDGEGWYVAILDTGVMSSHEMFTSKNVVEACFSTTDSTYKTVTNCPNGHSSQTGPGAAEPNTELHGTHVAGIAVGNNQSWSSGEPRYGVAPGADLLAIQVFSKSSSTLVCDGKNSCEVTFPSDQVSGLEYVYSLRNSLNIASTNMSLGAAGSSWSYTCDANNAELTSIIDNLKSAGIATVIAAGNDGSCYGINTPACITSAIAVGASTDADQRESYSNFATGMLDIYAPGSGVCSAVISSNSAYECHDGTSMATPHVAGAFALLRQLDQDSSVNQLLDLFTGNGAGVSSSCSGDTVRRLALSAVVDEYISFGTASHAVRLLLLN